MTDREVRDPARLAAVEATQLVGTGPEEVFDELAALAAQLLEAPYAFVTVVDSERSWWKSRVGLPPGGATSNTVEESFCQYVIGSGRELLVEDATTDPLTRTNPSVAAMGIRAWAGFPIRSTTGSVLGTFCVVDVVPRTWSGRDVKVLEALSGAVSRELALRAAVAAEQVASQVSSANEARLRALSLQTATLSESLQVGLLPVLDPHALRAGIDTHYQPGEARLLLGGDLYDVTRTPDGSLAFLIGDVAGHGAVPAALGASLRAAWRALALTHHGSARWLDGLELLFASERVDRELFVTVCTGTIDADLTTLSVRSAGHPPPILRHGDGRVEVLDVPAGPPVGLGGEAWPITTVDLERGWSLLLCTDGLFEGRREPGSTERLGLDAVACRFGELTGEGRPDGDTLDRLLVSVTASNGGPIEDDVAMLLLQAPPAGSAAPDT